MFWQFRNKRIYLDYAAAPPLLRAARAAMRGAEALAGNPGAIHAEGVAAKKSLEHSRETIAKHFGVKAREITFTPGLTAANNLAILGYAHALGKKIHGSHWVVSAIEHSSVLACFREVERMGGAVSYVQPDERGLITPEAVRAALTPHTVFVSIGWANGEVGTVQPLAEISSVVRAHGAHVRLHADAGQAPLYLPTLIHSLGVDLLSLGANKLYGPHGIGALYIRPGVSLTACVVGGAQERGLWAGTENVALAAGFAAAVEGIVALREKEGRRIAILRDELARELLEKVPGLVVNGNIKHSLPHLLNVSIPDISAEYLALALDHAGIAVSTKSACREGEDRESHVVAALYPDDWRAAHTIRFSLGIDTRSAHIRHGAEYVAAFVLKQN